MLGQFKARSLLIGGGASISCYASVLGRNTNQICAASCGSSILAGASNTVTLSRYSAILAGSYSAICESYRSTISTGFESNLICSDNASIAAGAQNTICGASQSFIGGGSEHLLCLSTGAAILSGIGNHMNWASDFSAIVGGNQNFITCSLSSTIAAGTCNILGGAPGNSVYSSAILTGYNNKVCESSLSSVVSGKNNIVCSTSYGSTVLSGGNNTIVATAYSGIGAGNYNCLVSAPNSLIAGGRFNTSCGCYTFIGAAYASCINSGGYRGVILAGNTNTLNYPFGVILGGTSNSSFATHTLIWGRGSTTAANYSIALGSNARASLDHSLALGAGSFTEAVAGEAQTVIASTRGVSTSTTPLVLSIDNTSNMAAIPSYTSWSFIITVAATNPVQGHASGFKFEGIAYAGSGSITLVNSTKTVLGESNPATDASIAVDVSTQSLQVSFVGVNSQTYYVLATYYITQVGFNPE